jgi:hypothetical protein
LSRKARHATICLMNTPGFAASALVKAREKLLIPTPLNRDCGRLCDAACCQADEEGLGGMLLFPGEAALYEGKMPGGFVISADDSVFPGGQLLTCEGVCRRANRPLACRLFPLVILLKEGKPRLALDPRAWPICPLMPSGLQGLSSGFVAAAESAAELLAGDQDQWMFLKRQTAFLQHWTRSLWEGGILA